MPLDHLNVLFLHLHVFQSITDIFVHLSFYHINKSCKYLFDVILDLIMHLFFLIQNLQLLVFCIDDLEYMAILNYVLHCFHLEYHQLKQLCML